MLRFVFATLMLAILSTLPAVGHAVENGTRTIVSDLSYWALIARVEAAIKRQKLTIISRASVRGAERQKKLGIPGNMVIGAFDDDTTTRILRANVAAGIEAPIRFYITRGADDKTATLWYRRPSWVLAPYGDKSGELRTVGEELDRLMETIAAEATQQKKRTNRVMVKHETGKPKTPKPAAEKPKTPERVVKAVPARTVKAAPVRPVKAAKSVTKRAEPVPAKALKAAAVVPPKAAGPRKLLGPPNPLTSAKPAAPVARAAPKPLTAAVAKTADAKPQQRAKAPTEVRPRPLERAADRQPAQRPAVRAADNGPISLSPLMLRLQGQ